MNAIHGRDGPKLERVDALQAPNVVPVLTRIRTPLMVCVDSAMATKVVLRRARVELIQPKGISALNDADAGKRNRGHNRAPATAHRAIAAPWIDDSVGQIQFQHHSPAVASEPMLRFDFRFTHKLDHDVAIAIDRSAGAELEVDTAKACQIPPDLSTDGRKLPGIAGQMQPVGTPGRIGGSFQFKTRPRNALV